MEILRPAPTVKAGSDHFVGDAWFDTLVRGEEPSRVRAAIVHFAPGARNAWHSHAVGQTVHVTGGVGRMQSRGAEVIEVRAGDTVHTPPGEWHWHGAAPEHFMTHFTVYEAAADGAETEWGEQVTDADYLAEPARRAR
jgi:quercetin dioxygenase-like cupin family protein